MKEETKYFIIRDTLMLAFSIGALIMVQRMMGDDVLKPLRMRALLGAKRVGQSQADAWQKFANAAATSYNKAKL